MYSLTELAKQLSQPSKPFAQWQPSHCGELPITINTQGEWFYAGSVISREAMVKLFASVLCKEDDTFYLKTPVEKIAISVADAPFIITEWYFQPTQQGQALCCIDNLQRVWVVTEQQPLLLYNYQQQLIPYIILPNGLSARVARNVYYQWAEIAQADQQGYFIVSASQRYYISKT
ncbi:DUF1285 domain-containing protein [Pseudoalteromonas mariniglutinosa]|uniref:DUF1285 domain-containing protein n=1 Tax=Pseudoalteromonas mariniglutinosa TaxID=206042 RepID=UPI0038502B13